MFALHSGIHMVASNAVSSMGGHAVHATTAATTAAYRAILRIRMKSIRIVLLHSLLALFLLLLKRLVLDFHETLDAAAVRIINLEQKRIGSITKMMLIIIMMASNASSPSGCIQNHARSFLADVCLFTTL